jgi:hypothetical protein
MDKNIPLLFCISLNVCVLSIYTASERPVYYICVIFSLLLNLIIFSFYRRSDFSKQIMILFFIIVLSSFLGLVNYLFEINGDKIRYSTIQTLTFLASSCLQYLLYGLIIANTYNIMLGKSENEKVSFFSSIVCIILLARVINIYVFDDVVGDDGRYYLGYYLTLLLPLLLYILYRSKNLVSFINVLLILLITYACFNLYLHRAIVLILPIIILFSVLIKFTLKKIFYVVLGIICFYMFFYEYIEFSDKYLYRLNVLSDLSFSDTSSSDRLDRLIEMLELMFKYPISIIVGFSPGASESLTSTVASHSAMFGFLFDVGLVNFLLFSYIIIVPIIKNESNSSEFYGYLKSFFLGVLILSIFYYGPAFPVSEIKVIDFSIVCAVCIGTLHSYRASKIKS